jgi:glycerol kinase
MAYATRPVVLAVDQGTTNTKAVLVAADGTVLTTRAAPVGLSHPRPGWVEQDGDQLWSSVEQAVAGALAAAGPVQVVGLALSTQRESVLAWSRRTGRPLGPVLGWQDQRTDDQWASRVEETTPLVRPRTGLQVDAMFSAPKMGWLLQSLAAHPPDDICLGTIDSWLVWCLTGGAEHLSEAGNAARTLLFDIRELVWSPPLLDLFGVRAASLPAVRASDAGFGSTRGLAGVPDGTPILAVLADSHAALLGQGCTEPGSGKATYGTGTSVMTPDTAYVDRDSPVATTLAWVRSSPSCESVRSSPGCESVRSSPGEDSRIGTPTYAREGNIVSSGSALAWTAALLGLPGSAELVTLAASVPDRGGVTLVPAFSGLAAPHWNRRMQASLSGLTGGSGPAQVARAAVDAVAQQVCDVVEVVDGDGTPLTVLRADGGATAAPLLMQTQADLLGRPVEVAEVAEVSAVGAAALAWSVLGTAPTWVADRGPGRTYEPRVSEDERAARRAAWRQEVRWSSTRPAAR